MTGYHLRARRASLPLVLLAILALGGFARCDFTDPTPRTRARFALQLSGAVDTSARDGLGKWTDRIDTLGGVTEHQLALWADPAPGQSTAPRLLLELLLPLREAALDTGIAYRAEAGVRVLGTLALGCPAPASADEIG